jgi:hypothetical protein
MGVGLKGSTCQGYPTGLVRRGSRQSTVIGDIELEIGTGPRSGNDVVRVIRAAAGGEPTGTLALDVEEILLDRGKGR